MRKLLVVLLVLGVLGFAADRVAAALVSGEAEERLSAEGFTDPEVEVHGFPVLTQLARRTLDDVTVTSPLLTAEQGTAREVRADLRGLRVPSGGGQVSVSDVQANGLVPYAEVVAAVGDDNLRLSAAGSGQVRVVRPVTVLGRTLRVAGRARVEASGNVIRLVPTGVELVGGGRIDDTLTDAVRGRVALEYTIPDLPDGVRVESVTPEAGGFRVSVSGTEVTLPAG